VIQNALMSSKPKARYLAGIGLSGSLVLLLRDFVWDIAVRQMFKAN
jgi:hypothetical protein